MIGGERLVVGLVRSVTGLRGAVRVEVLTDRPSERFAPGQRLYREGRDEPLTVLSAQPDGPGWRVQFAEITDRTSAESLRDVYLEGTVGLGQALPRGEYYWHEVIGSTVRDLGGGELGTVRDVYRAGGAEVLVVAGGRFGELDVPAVRSVVRIFAPRRGEIVVDADALGLSEPSERSKRRRLRVAGDSGAPSKAEAEAEPVPASGDDIDPGREAGQGSEAGQGPEAIHGPEAGQGPDAIHGPEAG